MLVLLPVDLVPLAAGVPDKGADALPQQVLLRPAGLVERLVADLEDPPLGGRDGLRLLDGVAKELVVKADQEVIRDEGPVHDVGLAPEDGVPVLHAVEVLVEAHEGNLAQCICTLVEHADGLVAVLAVAREPLCAGNDVYALNSLDARRRGELEELNLLRRFHKPHLQGEAFALRLIGVAHQVVAENDHPGLLEGKSYRIHLEMLLGIQLEGPAVVFDQVNQGEPPAHDPREELLDILIAEVGVFEGDRPLALLCVRSADKGV
mmetsp:Transcript_29589/g.79919  ORF Transcript_29589/g.79919 Transcript_29589/m.79919 type:complete len:263 (+) Transcript_29589:1159-1947(+)